MHIGRWDRSKSVRGQNLFKLRIDIPRKSSSILFIIAKRETWRSGFQGRGLCSGVTRSDHNPAHAKGAACTGTHVPGTPR